jgi:hypothetical protein
MWIWWNFEDSYFDCLVEFDTMESAEKFLDHRINDERKFKQPYTVIKEYLVKI